MQTVIRQLYYCQRSHGRATAPTSSMRTAYVTRRFAIGFKFLAFATLPKALAKHLIAIRKVRIATAPASIAIALGPRASDPQTIANANPPVACAITRNPLAIDCSACALVINAVAIINTALAIINIALAIMLNAFPGLSFRAILF